jgi:hypothetical protein
VLAGGLRMRLRPYATVLRKPRMPVGETVCAVTASWRRPV